MKENAHISADGIRYMYPCIYGIWLKRNDLNTVNLLNDKVTEVIFEH